MRAQFNVRIEKSTLKHIAQDRKSSGVTNDIIAEVALENWFTGLTHEKRQGFYRAHNRRPYSRGAK